MWQKPDFSYIYKAALLFLEARASLKAGLSLTQSLSQSDMMHFIQVVLVNYAMQVIPVMHLMGIMQFMQGMWVIPVRQVMSNIKVMYVMEVIQVMHLMQVMQIQARQFMQVMSNIESMYVMILEVLSPYAQHIWYAK